MGLTNVFNNTVIFMILQKKECECVNLTLTLSVTLNYPWMCDIHVVIGLKSHNIDYIIEWYIIVGHDGT